jgi:hypothetical protein
MDQGSPMNLSPPQALSEREDLAQPVPVDEEDEEDLKPDSQLAYDPYLTTLGFSVNTWLNALVCQSCKYAVLPRTLSSHLNDKHKDAQLRVDQTELDRVVQEFSIEHDFPVINNNTFPPFDGLQVYDGYACDQCEYACAKKDTIKRHYKNTHASRDYAYTTATVQNMSPGAPNLSKYWVCMAVPQQREMSMAPEALSFVEQAKETAKKLLDVKHYQVDKRQIEPWLLMTHWTELVDGLDIDEVHGLVEAPVKNSWETLVPKVVAKYMNDVLNEPMEELQLQMLNTPVPLKGCVLWFQP